LPDDAANIFFANEPKLEKNATNQDASDHFRDHTGLRTGWWLQGSGAIFWKTDKGIEDENIVVIELHLIATVHGNRVGRD
jgi:hypothetical protein